MKNKFILVAIIYIVINSCVFRTHKYSITKNHIKSHSGFYQGFRISELKVDSLDSNGIPCSYKKLSTAHLYLKDTSSRHTVKKIKFYEASSYYAWHYYDQWNLPILPITIKQYNWYLIEGLVFWGNPSMNKFIYVSGKGKLEIHTVVPVSNW